MTSKRVNIILAIALLLSMSLNAQFRHSAKLDPVNVTGFYSIAVTPELASYLKTDLGDLRIVDQNKRPVPFIVEWPYEKRAITPGLFDEKITSKITADYKTTLIIENAAKVELSNFILELKTAAAERTGSLSGSENGKEWYAILDSLMLRPGDEYTDTSRLQRINFPASTYKYYRLTIYNNKKEPLNILNARSWSATIPLDSIPRFFGNPQPLGRRGYP